MSISTAYTVRYATKVKSLHIIRVSCIQMKKLLLISAVVGSMGTPAFADITHRMQSSVSLSTGAAATQVERIGSTYSVSGSGVDTSWQKYGSTGSNDVTAHGVGGLDFQSSTDSNSVTTQNSFSNLGTMTATQQTTTTGTGNDAVTTGNGTAFSFTQSFTEGDTIVTTGPTVGAVSNYSSQVSTGVGTGTGTGSVTSGHGITVGGGGSGTTSIGQFTTELNIN